ncbi:MAG: Gfo/Idh/MocA family protein [Pirellulaceae bacterium]
MNENQGTGLNRREVIKKTGQAAMVTALAGVAIPHVHAAETGPIQVALVGCGGRGTGAAGDAMANKTSPVKLVAMADVFENRLAVSHKSLKSQFGEKVEVADDRRFLGFDGYKQAMDALRPGDVVILTTPPAFRWVHFKYAIDKGLNVFMEKPITVDGPSTRKMLALGEESVKKNLKVGVGLMCRHCPARQELFERIQNGEIGDLLLLRAYRVAGPTGSAFARAKPEDMTELMYQIKNFHAFLWASGGGYSDFLIHNIDESCWMKDAWPVEAKGFGGRHYRGEYVDQNFDTYTTEFTFADGSKLMLEGRCMPGCHQEFASYAHGSKGSAIISTSSHWPSKARIFGDQRQGRTDKPTWQYGEEKYSPYRKEWDDLIGAIIRDEPYNEVKRGAEASLVTAMGRMACHTGQIVTFQDMLNHEQELGPGVDALTFDSPAPVRADEHGKYPVPQPGVITDREYA